MLECIHFHYFKPPSNIIFLEKKIQENPARTK